MGTSFAEDHLAWAGLNRVIEPPTSALTAFINQVGAPAAWRAIVERRAPRAILTATADLTGGLDWNTARRQAESDLRAADRAGATLLTPDDPSWPAAALAGLVGGLARGVVSSSPPMVLWLRGRLPVDLPTAGVAVIGSRACSPYGRQVASQLGADLVKHGRTLVSGAAFGVDTAAHTGALEAQRTAGAIPTVAVLPCGIDRPYPEANRGLIDRIAEAGGVLTEYPPGTRPARHRFRVRNRLITALGSGTVIVEAGRLSDALGAAATAVHQGRLVMAIPGPITSATSVGCHQLLADRTARMVTGADDVLTALNERGAARACI